MRPRALFLAAWTLAGCYRPSPADGGFKCNADNGYLCPEGLVCDRRPEAQLCVRTLPDAGMGLPDGGGFTLDLLGYMPPTSCDLALRAGHFSNLTNLTALNTAADETSVSITADGMRLYYQSGGLVMTALLTAPDAKSANAPTGIAIVSAPAQILGGSVTNDGSFWFAGSTDGTQGALYQAQGALPILTAALQVTPQASGCAFTDAVFAGGVSTGELYLSFPLGGCGTPPSLARGSLSKNLGAFYAAFPMAGFRSASFSPSKLTMLVGTSTSPRRLYYATRASTDETMGDTQWGSPVTLPLDGLGAGSAGDWQAVVSPSCKTLYLVGNRPGTHGGSDLWAADITM